MVRKKQSEFYSLDNIMSKSCHYNLIFGERSNGKTYACLKYAIEQYAKHGYQTAILRRFREDFTGKRGAEMFNAITINNEVTNITDGKWNGIHYYGSRWYLCKFGENDKGERTRAVDDVPFAFGFSISSMEHEKGSSYPNIKTVVFDEFITRGAYLTDEFILFTNTLSTIIRQRNDVKIFMLGNTVNKYCPYFTEMGLKHIREMKQGDIDVYKVGSSGLKIAVEYCGTSQTHKKKSDIYFSFDNPRLEMITNGIWEIDIYPHCPCRYTPKDILFTYFMEFDGELLQCEIVGVGSGMFTFIHRKTTPLKNEDGDLIYSRKYDHRPNWRRNILKDNSKVGQRIRNYFNTDSVYYQDNEVGEIVRNYLQWCGKAV